MLQVLKIAILPLVLLVGCGSEPSGGPPEIRYGLEECSYCRMIISEERFAAITLGGDGSVARYDDVGCQVRHLREPSVAPKQVWVHGPTDWLSAESAWFVRDPKGKTPMGSGLVAFASRSQAEIFSSETGTPVTTWKQLRMPPSTEE